MGTRNFSDSIKLSVIRNSLEKNNGNIVCEICEKNLCQFRNATLII